MPVGCKKFGESAPMRDKIKLCAAGVLKGDLCNGVPKPTGNIYDGASPSDPNPSHEPPPGMNPMGAHGSSSQPSSGGSYQPPISSMPSTGSGGYYQESGGYYQGSGGY